MKIRRFREEDAKQISNLICRNFKEVNSMDYPLVEIKRLISIFTPEYIRKRASRGHMYVACDEEKSIGTATISDYYGSKSECIILSVFVLPELHGKGIGRMLIETLEKDELAIRAERIEIPASITACDFYKKCGYHYKNGKKCLDNEGHIRMEKRKENGLWQKCQSSILLRN